MRLSHSNSDRERVAELANLYSLILALDYLERAHVRDAVSPQEYHPACTRLLSQYKTILHLVGSNPSLDEFMNQYRLDCTAAKHRLQVGVPATVEHHHGGHSAPLGESNHKSSNGQPANTTGNGGNETAQWVAETTQVPRSQRDHFFFLCEFC